MGILASAGRSGCLYLVAQVAKRPHKHKDPTSHGFWNGPLIQALEPKPKPRKPVACGLFFWTTWLSTSTPQLPFKKPQIPSNRDYKAPNRGTLGGLGRRSLCLCRLGGPRRIASRKANACDSRRALVACRARCRAGSNRSPEFQSRSYPWGSKYLNSTYFGPFGFPRYGPCHGPLIWNPSKPMIAH